MLDEDQFEDELDFNGPDAYQIYNKESKVFILIIFFQRLSLQNMKNIRQ